MNCPKDVVEFVTEWWEFRGSVATTIAAWRRLKTDYPKGYLLTYCHPQEIAQGAAAMQEICQSLETIASMRPNKAERLAGWETKGRRG